MNDPTGPMLFFVKDRTACVSKLETYGVRIRADLSWVI